jgi:hypothetical protein
MDGENEAAPVLNTGRPGLMPLWRMASWKAAAWLDPGERAVFLVNWERLGGRRNDDMKGTVSETGSIEMEKDLADISRFDSVICGWASSRPSDSPRGLGSVSESANDSR